MEFPQDVIDIIFGKLDSHICPIYTLQDVARDKWTLLEFFDYPEKTEYEKTYKNLKKKQKRLSINYLKDVYNVDFDDDQFSKYYTYGRIDLEELRLKLLQSHNNSVFEWLIRAVADETCIEIPKWFAEYFFPLTKANEKTYRNIGNMWKFFEKAQIKITDEIIEFMKNYKNLPILDFENKIMKDMNLYKEITLSYLKNIKNLKTLLDDTDADNFNKVTVQMSREIAKELYHPELTNDYWSQKLYKTIIKKHKFSLYKVNKGASRANFIKFAKLNDIEKDVKKYLDIVEYEYYGNQFDTVSKNIDKFIHYKKLKNIIIQYNMTPIVHHDFPNKITLIVDNVSKFTTNDLYDLIKNIDIGNMTEEKIPKIRDCFDRYTELYDGLKNKRIDINKECEFCKEYVYHGTYNGPTEGFTVDSSTLERVINMVEENKFLDVFTKYRSIMARLDNKMTSERVKKDELFMYLKHKIPIKLPNRLQYLIDHIYKFKEEKEDEDEEEEVDDEEEEEDEEDEEEDEDDEEEDEEEEDEDEEEDDEEDEDDDEEVEEDI